MSTYLGDIPVGQILYTEFTTVDNTGLPTTASGLAISAYKNDSTTSSTAGITTTYSGGFGSTAGLVNVKVDTSADSTFYAAGNDFFLVATAGTVAGVSIVGYVVGEFSIDNRNQKVNVTKFGGTTVTARDIGASVLLSSGSGAGQISLSSGQVTVGTNNDKTGYTLSTTGQTNLLDQSLSGHTGAGTVGGALNTAGSPSDPWNTSLPGSYAAGKAGYILGTNLDTTVSSRGTGDATAANQTTILNRLGAFTGTGVNTVLGFFKALLRKDATLPSDIGGTYDNTTMSLEGMYAKIIHLPEGLPKNTAYSNFKFIMRSSTDHVTPTSGLTVTAQRSIDGGGFSACANSVSEISNGAYTIDLAATDLNGTSILFFFTAVGADPTFILVKTV
jgi:hypothetical protein